jgi:hypothetical protein
MYARLFLTMAAIALSSLSIELVCCAGRGRGLGVALEVVSFVVLMKGLLKFSIMPTSHKVLHVWSR